VIAVPFSLENEGAVGLAQLRRGSYDRVQYGLKAERRAADDFEDVPGCPKRLLDPLELGDVTTDDQQAAVCQRLEFELDVLPTCRAPVIAVNRRGTLTPRIASRRNVTGGGRGRFLMVRLEWRGCWRAEGRA
jgi:hypothetical protein